jgi:hypothetical protein
MSFITSPGVIVPPLTAGGVAYGTGGQAKMNNAGTTGQALLSGGAGVPTWGSAGSFTFISSQTVSTAVASVDFTTGIDSTYDDYQILFENVTQSVAGDTLRFTLYQSGAFGDAYSRITSSGISGGSYSGGVSVNEGSISAISPSASTTSTKWRGNLYLQAVNTDINRVPSLMGTVGAIGNTTDQGALQQILGVSNTTAVVTGFRVAFSTGNIRTGTFRLYGIAKS